MSPKSKSPRKRLRELSNLRIEGGMGGEGFDIEIEELERQLRLEERREKRVLVLLAALVGAGAGAVADFILDLFL